MTALTIGSLCSGYGGLDMALEKFFGAKTKWFSEFDPAPSKILAYRWPGVPNLGDMTKIDWSSVPRVHVMGGGTPCQDLSGAGARKGMTEGTRSNLWVQMREAIAVIRPSIVVWENVRGAFSAYATSEVESEPGLLGVYGLDRPALRALGRVLGDLSDLGYDTEWVGVRASDAGAPHGRFRVFVLAAYSGRIGGREGDIPARLSAEGVDGATVSHESDTRHIRIEPDADSDSGRRGQRDTILGGFPIAYPVGERTVADAERGGRDGRARVEVGSTVERATAAGDRADSTADAMRVRLGEHTGESFAEETWAHSGNELADHPGVRPSTDWGPYRPAIERWERVLGRFAQVPTEQSDRGSQRLSPRFVEFMMGLPEEWVTSPEIGLTRNQQLKALGNGVVPQQAELALSILWRRMVEAVAA